MNNPGYGVRVFVASTHVRRVECQDDAYRVVYAASFPVVVYVLHAFKKQLTHGIATSRRRIDLIERRLGIAFAPFVYRETHYTDRDAARRF